MGNHRFRLSDMIPNAWFYKLREMGKTKTSQSSKKNHSSVSTTASHIKKPHLSQSKQPCCNIQDQPRSFRVSDIDDIFPHLPRRPSSSQRKSRRKTIYKPSPRRIATSFNKSCSESSVDRDFLIYKSPSIEFESDWDTNDQPEFSKGLAALESSPCSCGFSYSDADIIIDVKETSFVKSSDKLDAFDTIPVLDLPPIFTKNKKFNDVPDEKETNFSMISPQLLEIEILDSLSINNLKEESGRAKKGMMKTTPRKKPARKKYASSPPAGIKLRTNSPRISSKKNQGPVGRRSISGNQKRLNSNNKEAFPESFAVVKASFDPEKDFRESMMEMILENNIRASNDLEDLLACYLTLNSNEYHDLIIKAFEQIWFDVLV